MRNVRRQGVNYMPKDWKDISDDEILNYNEAHTGQMARYGRISEKRTQNALGKVEQELSTLTKASQTSTDRLVDVGNRLITSIEADSKAQAKYQKAIVALTVVIAIATVAYTVITWQSVGVMRDANELQRIQMNPEATSDDA